MRTIIITRQAHLSEYDAPRFGHTEADYREYLELTCPDSGDDLQAGHYSKENSTILVDSECVIEKEKSCVG